MNLAYVIKKPVVTEKSLNESKLGRYTFEIDKNATKDQVKEALKTFFNVEAVKIRTITLKGTAKRTGRRRLPATDSGSKKAIVELKNGQSIKIFESQE